MERDQDIATTLEDRARARTLARLRDRLATLHGVLSERVDQLRRGSLRHQPEVWLNAAAACPVPERVVRDVARAAGEAHITLERGADRGTLEASALLQAQIDRVCARYCGGHGTLLFGANASHMLMALGRTLVQEVPAPAIAHGDVDHKASYALSSLPGWSERVLVPYSVTGFCDPHALRHLPRHSLFLLTVLHHRFGTTQRDALAPLDPGIRVVLDLSQALSIMPPAHLEPYVERAFAAVFNLGKVFCPFSLGVLWLRDPALARRVRDANPELSGSWSSFSIKALASVCDFIERAVDESWHEYIAALTRYALARLGELDHIVVIGCRSLESSSQKLSIISFTAAELSPIELGMYLGGRGFAVRADGRCTADGSDSGAYDCVRISLLPHVTPDDVDALVDALRACA